MINCPYCNEKLEKNWYYCHSCNKPLIMNLDIEDIHKKTSHMNSFQSDPLSNSNENSDFQIDMIEDIDLDNKIMEIEQKINNSSKNEVSIGDLFLQKASLYYKKRDLLTAQKELENALKNFEIEENQLKIAITHNEIGLLKEDLGYFEDSIYHFDRSIQILQNLEEYKKLVQVYNNIGNAYLQIKDIENAYKYYQNAIDISEKENIVYEEIKSLSNLIEILFVLKDYDRIKKILKRLEDFFNNNKDIYGLITTTLKYGKLYFFLGENYYDTSYDKLIDALDLVNKIENQVSLYLKSKLVWEIYLYLGKINLLRNNNSEAENYLLKSLECVRLYEVGNDNINESIILDSIATLYENKKEYEKAIEYYQLSSEIYFKFGEDYKTAELKLKIGFIYLKFKKNSLKSIDFYEQALKIYEEIEYFKESADIYNILGDIYIEKGLIDIALSHFEKAKNHYKELNDDYNSELVNEKINSLMDLNIRD